MSTLLLRMFISIMNVKMYLKLQCKPKTPEICQNIHLKLHLTTFINTNYSNLLKHLLFLLLTMNNVQITVQI